MRFLSGVWLKIFVVLLAVGSGMLTVGCGGDSLGRQPISGSVSVDGSPLERGTVNFHPVDTAASSAGGSITGGKYTLERQRGLSAGKYRVTINAPKPGTGGQAVEGAMPGDAIAPPVELIPPEWNSNSAQFVEVANSGKNEFNFDVKTKSK